MRFFIIFLLFGCTKTEPKTPDPVNPTQSILDRYESASGRLINMLDNGYVVSRNSNGGTEHLGDSLIWTGMALSVLPCDKGDQIESALFEMMDTLNGGMWRHPSLPDQISLDGAIGLYRGAAKRIMKCPNSRAKWTHALTDQLGLGKLNPNSDVTWPLEFKYVPELALAVASGTPNPDSDRMVALSGQVDAWATAVNLAHKFHTGSEACYRINLGYQTLRTLEELGMTVSKANFCDTTKDDGLSLVDRWCGRSDGAAFLDNFVYDEWEYHPQRCNWESTPDGQGFHTPGLDLIEMIHDSYTVPD